MKPARPTSPTALRAGLYLVATPIGNARDITLRALDILAGADVLAAEDTRTLRKLLEIHGVALGERPLIAYHDHSGETGRAGIVKLIGAGKSVAYASEAGIQNIMALRGDPPQGQESFQQVEGGLSYANELVSLIREHSPNMGIGVAGYPEKHPEAPNLPTDLDNLKRKVDAGADAVFTQLFYENSNFFRFRDACRARDIAIPIVPGIMPITEFARIKRITSMCGAIFPTELASRLEAVQEDSAAQFEIGVNYAIEQCEQLLQAGVPGIHFYALNKSEACDRILAALGVPQNG